MPRRVAVLTPFGPPAVRGNAVTVARIALGLAERGIDVRVWDLSAATSATIESEVEAYRPALVHAFHAHRTGSLAVRLAHRVEASLVLTLTGTDANQDLVRAETAPAVKEVLERADRITVFHQSIRDRVVAALPGIRPRLVVIAQAARLPASDVFDLPRDWLLPPRAILFVFPAGLRAVKNPSFPLAPLGRLVKAIPEIRLLYAGPVLEPAVGRALHETLSTTPWARHVGAVPHAQMASLLSRADVVLNCSISEGGMANSVLEALSLGRAVLASDIDGNRSLVADGSTGFLFRDEAEFERRAAELARDPALRERLGRAGAAMVADRLSTKREIDGYLELYQEVIAERPLRSAG
ncbi:MAG TPA: glycosyltransferase [Methylomirabilota bacterium]